MAHTLLYTLGYNAPEDRILPDGLRLEGPGRSSTTALKTLTAALRPWTIDFHVAQNDAHGATAPARTTRPAATACPTTPTASSTSRTHAGYWLRDEHGKLTKTFQHICWDGCMFPNDVMMKPQTWNDILAAMIAVRDAHGWNE